MLNFANDLLTRGAKRVPSANRLLLFSQTSVHICGHNENKAGTYDHLCESLVSKHIANK